MSENKPAPVAQGEPVAFVDLSACDCRNSVDDCDYPDCKAGRAAQAAPAPASQCAQCKKSYRHGSAAGCPKCAPGLSVPESEFCRPIAHASAARCPYCDGTGDVHTPTGEWRGSCICEAGKAAPAPVAQDEERIEAVLQRQYGQIAALEAEIAALKAAPAPVAQPSSPTAGMNMAQRILHVGGRNNAAGYVEFGSIQAVEALVRQVMRDLPVSPAQLAQDADPMDWPLPCDVRVGHVNIRKGCKLSTLVARTQALYNMVQSAATPAPVLTPAQNDNPSKWERNGYF